MSKSIEHQLMGAPHTRVSSEIARLLIDGRFSRAARKLRAVLAANPASPAVEAELACALAFAGNVADSERILASLNHVEHGAPVRARVRAAQALLASRAGQLDRLGPLLSEAYKDDPKFHVLDLLLARYFMIVDVDLGQAEEHLRRLVKSVPGSVNAQVHLAAVLSETGSRKEARRLAIQSALAHPTSVRAGLTALYASIHTLPLNGGVFMAALVLLLFVPCLGALILVGWTGLAVVSYLSIRRFWQRMVIVSALGIVVLSLGYAARWIFWGRLFP
jgi:tetratricopeptide (TPR) repeat protein